MPSPSAPRLLLATAALALWPSLSSCPDGVGSGNVDERDADADMAIVDIIFDTAPPPDADAADADGAATSCPSPGAFGCPCLGNGECLDGLCIEGPDGNLCTRQCVTECPDGFDCLTTSVGGPDPISLCVPRHTRLCRPCTANADCQSPLDPSPAACVADPDPSVGSFCATSCAQVPCPTGYACQDVPVGPASARLCLPTDAECACRASWQTLGLMTTCQQPGLTGACDGTRICGANGLTMCDARIPSAEVCNGVDDDCDGTTDNIPQVACDNTNVFGTCAGLTACGEDGEVICAGQVPGEELCNDRDDDCDGNTDETFSDCLPAGCDESDGVFFASGEPSCVRGDCVYPTPRPCGLYTCSGGGNAGEVCATSCEDDSTCIAAAHCDERTNTCVPDILDGAPCLDQSDCASGHCQNGFCCAEGDCCNQPSDCPEAFRVSARCDDPSTCQGARRDALCVSAMCRTSDPIADDSGCGVETLALDCSPNVPRYCTGALNQNAPSCPTTCQLDSECVEGFHCDGTCVPDVPDGGACDEPSDCVSGYCGNGFCCAAGDCCDVAAHCPDSWRDPPGCLDPVTCQGERIDAVCTAMKQCSSVIVQDDSRCDANTEANPCGPYRSVFCNGAVQQLPPQCPFSCSTDEACDPGFHCDTICLPDLPDGNFCDEDSDCISGHCRNNVCCSGGDCCTRAQDCPVSYSGDPSCDFPAACQGTRRAASCTNFVCGSVEGSPDDSACTAAVLANDCGLYPSVFCNGAVNQVQPVCPNRCDTNAQCDNDAYCENNQCRTKKPDGQACGDGAQCVSGHCQNGFCCASGDCCAAASNCSPAVYGAASVCEDVATCQGSRRDPVCAGFICRQGETPVPDDSGCAGLEANNCGYYDSVFCSAAVNQTAPVCPTSCTGNSICDDGANCTNGACVPDEGVGGPCVTSGQCGNGLTCVDGVCCTSTCTGTCQACNLPGALGLCQNIPTGADPADECGSVGCTGYYWGFEGRTCFQRGAVSAELAACGGDGSCQGPAELCPTAGRGPEASSCHPECQVPTPNTCVGTEPGACTNVTGGTQTCGRGVCARTVDRCENGAPKECVPGLPSGPEVCDGVDNDCDGLTDGEDPDLVLVACDNQSGVCGGAMRPASLCVGGQWQVCPAAVYAAHTPFYQAGSESSCDGRDNDCDGQTDEDFTYTALDGSQVVGAGKSCGVGVCAGGTTQCGLNDTLICSGDVRIAPEVCDGLDNDCDGRVDSLDASLILVPCQNQSGVCAGSVRPASLCASGTWQPCGASQYSAHSSFYQVTETLCDGRDNDCNGQVDNNLSAPPNDNQTGACAGSVKSCGGTNGWQNDYSAVPGYGLAETPNGNYLDENCDGVDGDVTLGLFTTSSGSASSSCTQAAPCNFARAIALASTSKPHIYLAAGNYTGQIWSIAKSVRIFGGYRIMADGRWVRAARGTSGHITRIYGGTTATEGHAVTLLLSGSGNSIEFHDLYLHGGNASGTYQGNGRNSYVIHATLASVLVERSDVIAGNGAAGAAGDNGSSATGSAAATGGTGTNAYTGSWGGCDTSTVSGGGGATNASCNTSYGNPNGGGGGRGGAPDTSGSGCGLFGCCCCYDPTSGTAGGHAAARSGTVGQGGPAGGTCGSATGGNGGGFQDGSGGAGTASTSNRGFLSNGFWVGYGGQGGTLGRNGIGGGGGGGTGGCDNGVDQPDTSGASGGGGGAGGCLAPTVGAGGFAGGGSFGIFGNQSAITVRNSSLTRGTGGTGGRGGAGGSGQPGGSGGGGGGGNRGSKAAAAGGAGGRGGHSGAGGGGAGGVSFGIYRYLGSLSLTGNSFNTGGAAGAGGAGGSGSTSGQNGTQGTAGAGGDTGTCSLPGGC